MNFSDLGHIENPAERNERIALLMLHNRPDGITTEELTRCVEWLHERLIDYSLADMVIHQKLIMRWDADQPEPTFHHPDNEPHLRAVR